jgi:hypothetical protein
LIRANTGLRIFYHVPQSHSLDKVLASPKKIVFFANSTSIYEYDNASGFGGEASGSN